ncbi:glycosyltransferase family 39 protein [Engelhardtia mirabilis]
MASACPLADPGAPTSIAGGRGGLWVALGLGLLLRLAGMGWGLPGEGHLWSFHPDEYRLVDAARRVATEPTLHPTRFQYGSLAVYLPAALGAPLAWLGVIDGPRGWHLVGRTVSLIAGLVAIGATWALARRLLGGAAATVAALALAVAPGAALLSAWATPDAPATAFVVLALASTARALDPGEGRPGRWLLIAGVVGGLAAAVKYSAGAVVLAPVVAAWIGVGAASARTRLARALLAGLASLATFAGCTPHAFLSSAEFLRDLEYELVQHPRSGHGNLFEATGDGWSYHLVTNLPFLLGWPLLAVGVIGLVPLARRGGRGGLIAAGFGLLVFGLLGTSKVRFMRYLLPLAPVLCVAAGALIAGRAERLTSARRLAATVLLVTTGALSTLQASALLAPDPRQRALEFCETELEPGALIGTTVVPTFFHPPFVRENGGPKLKPRFEARLAAGDSPFTFAAPTGFDPAVLSREAADAFVASEFDWREELRLDDPEARAFLAALDARYGAPQRFAGISPALRRLFSFGLSPAPHDWLYPFQEVWVWGG